MGPPEQVQSSQGLCCSSNCLQLVSMIAPRASDSRLTTVHEHEALVVFRPDYLALVDLPEHAFLLTWIVQPLLLPAFTGPVLIAGHVRRVPPMYSSNVHVRTVLGVTVCVDVVLMADGANIAVPWLACAVPPVLRETGHGGDRRIIV